MIKTYNVNNNVYKMRKENIIFKHHLKFFGDTFTTKPRIYLLE